jgi:hypothetical protein
MVFDYVAMTPAAACLATAGGSTISIGLGHCMLTSLISFNGCLASISVVNFRSFRHFISPSERVMGLTDFSRAGLTLLNPPYINDRRPV